VEVALFSWNNSYRLWVSSDEFLSRSYDQRTAVCWLGLHPRSELTNSLLKIIISQLDCWLVSELTFFLFQEITWFGGVAAQTIRGRSLPIGVRAVQVPYPTLPRYVGASIAADCCKWTPDCGAKMSLTRVLARIIFKRTKKPDGVIFLVKCQKRIFLQ
jgi:hypothetical protein